MLNSKMAMKIVYGLKIFVDHTLNQENKSYRLTGVRKSNLVYQGKFLVIDSITRQDGQELDCAVQDQPYKIWI